MSNKKRWYLKLEGDISITQLPEGIKNENEAKEAVKKLMRIKDFPKGAKVWEE
ncbi:MAG: hypothetical protein GQ474_00530 [Sulfurimonas sp.]|nr:hypothetical protein [Sulfurimonas sp.]